MRDGSWPTRVGSLPRAVTASPCSGPPARRIRSRSPSAGPWSGRRSHRSRHTPGAPDGRHRLLRPHRQHRAHPARGGRRLRARAVFDAWNAGLDDADARQAAATTIRRAIDRIPGIPAQKYLIAHHRNDPAWRAGRPPMTPLADDASRDLLGALSETEFDGARLAIR